MKKQILIAACLLGLIACNKGTVAPVPSSQMFTAPGIMETSLMGTWYLDQQVITHPQDTTVYTGYQYPYYYILFKWGLVAPFQKTDVYCKSYTSTWMPNTIGPRNISGGLPTVYGGVKTYTDTAGVVKYDSV